MVRNGHKQCRTSALISALIAVKHCTTVPLTPPLQPGTQPEKIIDMSRKWRRIVPEPQCTHYGRLPLNHVFLPSLKKLRSRTVGNLAHTTGQVMLWSCADKWHEQWVYVFRVLNHFSDGCLTRRTEIRRTAVAHVFR